MKLDPSFFEVMKDRIAKVRETIRIEETVEALQQCVAGTKILDKEQIAAARILLAKVIPDLKAVEHTDNTPRELTREQLIERLAQLHSGTAQSHERQPAQGAGESDGATSLQH